MHFGVTLPNYGAESSGGALRRTAQLAEELGFDSVWTTEHIIVGPEAVDPYGRVFEPFVTLAWLAAQTERIALGTSVTLLPLHHPIYLAKQVATLAELSGDRIILGVGMGWHQDEFNFMRVELKGRGTRADEGLRLMRALWNGEREFAGEHWSIADATFGPLPSRQPEIWVGGPSERARRRALEFGGAWHPTGNTSPEDVARMKQKYPQLRIVPRTSPQHVDAMLEAGADGAVINIDEEAAMRAFASAYLER